MTDEGTQWLADLFEITIPIHKKDFFFYFADIFTMGVQYGTRVDMCEKLVAANVDNNKELMQAVSVLAKNGGLTYD